jgi:hypothetical protein
LHVPSPAHWDCLPPVPGIEVGLTTWGNLYCSLHHGEAPLEHFVGSLYLFHIVQHDSGFGYLLYIFESSLQRSRERCFKKKITPSVSMCFLSTYRVGPSEKQHHTAAQVSTDPQKPQGHDSPSVTGTPQNHTKLVCLSVFVTRNGLSYFYSKFLWPQGYFYSAFLDICFESAHRNVSES